jgi:pimeloyl-ACP methyl ester carboxylesterase
VDTVILLGSGQWGKIPRWVAENAPAGTVVVEGLPHRAAQIDGRDLKDFSRDYTTVAFRAVLGAFNIPSAHIVALSQAAPGAIWMARDCADQVRNVALVTPLGFTADILGVSARERLSELKRRTARSSLQFSQSPLRSTRQLYLSWLLLKVLLVDARWQVSGQKYAVGASQDLRQDCQELAEQLARHGGRLTLILGGKDKLFPSHEVTTALRQAQVKNVQVITLADMAHPALVARADRRMVERIVGLVRSEG